MVEVPVATWNINHWQRSSEQREASKTFLAEQVAPDIALLQEAAPEYPFPHSIHPDGGIDGKLKWGSAVAGRWPLTEVRTVTIPYGAKEECNVVATRPGAVVVADVEIDGGIRSRPSASTDAGTPVTPTRRCTASSRT
jgi:hypothetical protein